MFKKLLEDFFWNFEGLFFQIDGGLQSNFKGQIIEDGISSKQCKENLEDKELSRILSH